MTHEELQNFIKTGEAEFTKQEPQTKEQKQPDPLQDFIQVLAAIRKPKIHLTAEPAFTPKNFAEQIQFYDDGADIRIYFYINNTWRYATLT